MTEIYVQTGTKDIRVQKTAKAKYVISATVNGILHQKDGTVLINNATSKAAALAALSEALGRFQRADVIKIYISDDYVRHMLMLNMPNRWEANDWHKLRYNRELKYMPYWKSIKAMLSAHAVKYASADEIRQSKLLKELEWRMTNVRG